MDKLTALLLFSQVLALVTGQTCQNWVSVPQDQFNRTYVDLDAPNANLVRPLGFEQTTLRFQEASPCYTVSNLAGNDRHIEIKWELELPGTICVANNVMNGEQCSTGRTNQICSSVPGGRDAVTFTFQCEGSNCETGDRQFWFRFLVEQPDQEMGFDENWCMTLDSMYPSSLAPIPAITPPSTVKTTSGAGTIVSSTILLLILTIIMQLR